MLISKLIKIANALDYKGLTTEANEIDDLILRLAMTRGEALGLLGLSPAATKEEINIAFKSKALKTHPDLGGNEETMKHLNVARDVLLEDAVPEIVPEKPAYREPEKKVVKEQDGIKIKLSDLGYDKLLGSGKVNHPLIIEAKYFSKNAIKKLEEAKGKAIVVS